MAGADQKLDLSLEELIKRQAAKAKATKKAQPQKKKGTAVGKKPGVKLAAKKQGAQKQAKPQQPQKVSHAKPSPGRQAEERAGYGGVPKRRFAARALAPRCVCAGGSWRAARCARMAACTTKTSLLPLPPPLRAKTHSLHRAAR